MIAMPSASSYAVPTSALAPRGGMFATTAAQRRINFSLASLMRNRLVRRLQGQAFEPVLLHRPASISECIELADAVEVGFQAGVLAHRVRPPDE
ncbi:MAG: hypothetical protein JWO38_1975 [Gemmataceae bacterium]|nr:hypothetical protein [Gemmataceae bacterium]